MVAVPVLTIADDADGSGGTATVAGSTGGTTNTLYSQTINGELGSATWTSRGSRTGDGTISVSISSPTTYYWWKLVSTDGSDTDVSNLVYQPLTDGTEAVHYRFMLAIQARLQGLTFAAQSGGGSIASADIVVRKVAIDQEGHIPDKPCILIAPGAREKINHAGGTNIRDEVSYPVGIVILAADNRALTTNLAAHLKWREQIVRALENFRPTSVPEINRSTVDPEAIFPLPQWMKNLVASAVVCQGEAWQSRGLT